jgi:chromosome partitioning protein
MILNRYRIYLQKVAGVMILAVAQTKGGVGKTTLAINIAIERVRCGHDVLLVDADDQRTASDFTALREQEVGATGYTAVELSGAAVRTQVLKLAPKYDDVVIDVGGRDTASLRAALTVADVALTPFLPRTFDVWTLGKMAELIEEARIYNDRLRAFAALNMCDPAGSDNVAAAEALRGNEQIAYLNAPVGRRKAFANAAALGRGVLEMERRDSQACGELSYLASKLFTTDIARVA